MRRYLLSTLLALFLVPLIAGAQTLKLIPCVGGDACRACDLVQLAQNVMEFGFVVLVPIIFILVIVSAGFKMITSGQGSGLLKAAAVDIVTGLIIALCAWLVIDTGLKLLIKDPSFGPWNNVQCVDNPRAQSAGGWAGSGSVTPGGDPYTGPTGGGVQCNPENTSCSVAALQAVGYTENQANVMSCIAMTESTGNPNAVNPSGGACGTFQALPFHWNQSYAPAGCGPGNCTNANCSLRMAYTLSQMRVQRGQSPYADWTCPGCNNKAQACVNRYDPGR